MAQDQVRWGVLGTAGIARRSFIPAVKETTDGVLQAIGSRDAQRAAEFAEEYGFAQSYGSYEEILADPRVDAVYIPLPNTMHVEWIKKAAAAGKHVFCEKPLTMTYDEAVQAVDACKAADVLLVEAFVYRFHGQSEKLRQLLDQQVIGETKHTDVRFHFNFAGPADDIRVTPELGGGARLDVGCYGVNWSRFVMNAEPVAVLAEEVEDVSGVDASTLATFRFEGGRTALISSSIRMTGGQRARIYGPNGTIQVTDPFQPIAAQGDRPASSLWVEVNGEKTDKNVPVTNHPFTDAVSAMHRAILAGEPLPFDTMHDALEQARVMDAVALSAREGRWVELN